MLQFSPKIAEESKPHVHHMLVYQCATISLLTDELQDWSGECHSAPSTVESCRGTNILAGWAIGGEVNLNNELNIMIIMQVITSLVELVCITKLQQNTFSLFIVSIP